MKILVTGGAGYIGAVTARALEQSGHTPIIFDSLVRGPRRFTAGRIFYQGDVADRALLETILSDHPDVECTIHMAGRVDVAESVADPDLYFLENVAKSSELFQNLIQLGHSRILFSSSASVYGPSQHLEVFEASSLDPASPYAKSKLMIEQTLITLAKAGRVKACIFRYFNPLGASPDLTSGSHLHEPTHVLGRLLATAVGDQSRFVIAGTDYPTPDGTPVRDYVHVWDIARAHVLAAERLDAITRASADHLTVLNLGRGAGVTVRQLARMVEEVLDVRLDIEAGPRRPGDVVGAFANVEKARHLLGWRAELPLEEAIMSARRWEDIRRRVLG